jgi:hypothetical protein
MNSSRMPKQTNIVSSMISPITPCRVGFTRLLGTCLN